MAGNILNFNSKKIQLRLSDSDYHDFYLAKDEYCVPQTNGLNSDCLVAHFDFNENDMFHTGATSANTIYSLATWSGATNTGYTIDTLGLTGIDNGLVTFVKEPTDTSNLALLSALTGTTLIIPEGFDRLCLNRVTGMTGDYIYPMELVQSNEPIGDYMNFCGGFYQGYYKIDGTTYEVLPNRVPKAWVAEFWVNKSDTVCSASTSGLTGTTLNELYPDNKGIFFYMGTRAENKFWNQFEGLNTGTTSACTNGATEWCTVPKETDISLIDGESGLPFPISPPLVKISEISNQFLIYGRAHDGGGCNSWCATESNGMGTKLACNFTGTSIFVSEVKMEKTDDRNPFLIYSRAKAGSSFCSPCGTGGTNGVLACNYSGDSQPMTQLDWKADVEDNALAFIIKDDGSIGYRLLTASPCSGDTKLSGCQIEESFSASGMVQDDEWTNISIRFVSNQTYDECELETKGPREGKLMFYVNCMLKHVAPFDEFIAKRLGMDCEHWMKQVGVPYNISLGGGSQGLLETMTFDGQDPSDLGLCIQENFAGTFIGSISQFRFHICDLNWCDLKANCAEECERYGTCVGCRP